jgi:hypothetical protein
VLTIDPDNGRNIDVEVNAAITGAWFQDKAEVKLSLSGQPDIVATGIRVRSAAEILCVFNLRDALPGRWDLVVTNPDGGRGILPGAFTIRYPAPEVLSINPAGGVNNEVAEIEQIAGQYFRASARVTLSLPGESDIVATAVEIPAANKIACLFDLRGKAPGVWDLTVTNSDGQAATLERAFKLEAPELTLVKPPEFAPVLGADNSLRKGVEMKYNLSQDSDTQIEVFNIRGERIWTNVFPAGTRGGSVGANVVAWNGQTSYNIPASAGVYIIMIYSRKGGEVKLLAKQKIAIVK